MCLYTDSLTNWHVTLESRGSHLFHQFRCAVPDSKAGEFSLSRSEPLIGLDDTPRMNCQPIASGSVRQWQRGCVEVLRELLMNLPLTNGPLCRDTPWFSGWKSPANVGFTSILRKAPSSGPSREVGPLEIYQLGTHPTAMPAVVPGSVQNTCGIKVGRLLEIRVLAGYRTPLDVDQLFDLIGVEYAKLKEPQRVVAVTDWRYCPPISDDISNYLLERIAATNPRTQASAALVSRDSPTAVLQFLRVVRGSKHPGRKLFFEVSEMLAWVHPFLTGSEFRRLRTFMDAVPTESVQLATHPKRGGRAQRA